MQEAQNWESLLYQLQENLYVLMAVAGAALLLLIFLNALFGPSRRKKALQANALPAGQQQSVEQMVGQAESAKMAFLGLFEQFDHEVRNRREQIHQLDETIRAKEMQLADVEKDILYLKEIPEEYAAQIRQTKRKKQTASFFWGLVTGIMLLAAVLGIILFRDSLLGLVGL